MNKILLPIDNNFSAKMDDNSDLQPREETLQFILKYANTYKVEVLDNGDTIGYFIN